jgi:hypothetical protein
MRKHSLMFLLLVVLLITVSAASAQTGQRIPAIVQFTSGTPSFTVTELEAGTAQTVLAWHIINIANQRITLESYSLSGWQSLLGEDETLPPVGTREVAVAHPLTFGTPTYRLAVVDDDEGRVVSEQYLTIPYTEAAEAPTIEQFTTDTTELNSAELIQRSARALVRWSVTGRTPTSNLLFEQVLSPEDVISVELPREFLWVPSQGQGEVAPDVPLALEAGVVLRLTVIDVITGTIYDQAEITVPVTGAELSLPPAAAPKTPAPTQAVGCHHARRCGHCDAAAARRVCPAHRRVCHRCQRRQRRAGCDRQLERRECHGCANSGTVPGRFSGLALSGTAAQRRAAPDDAGRFLRYHLHPARPQRRWSGSHPAGFGRRGAVSNSFVPLP